MPKTWRERVRQRRTRKHKDKDLHPELRRWGQSFKYHNLRHYIDKLESGNPFTFTRWGDGEWFCVLGDYGMTNNNGCTFNAQLGEMLREALAHSYPYEHSILRIARRKQGKRIGSWLAHRPEIQIEWTIGDTFLESSLNGRLFPLIEHLRERKVMYVGPPWTKDLPLHWFPLVAHVQPPARDAYKERSRVVGETLNKLEKSGAEIIGWSSGLHTKVFADDVFAAAGDQVTQIDFGSMWDPYFGVNSRSYARSGRHNFRRLRAINTEGA